MHRCLQLAKNGLGRVAPNPLVGSIIVHNNKIIGEGFHQKYGSSHAEVNAIQSVKNQELLKGSTVFVSLEPCSHHGKTPPCADLIMAYKIPKVVIAMQDPNPKVSGRGIAKLREAGIEVIEGICKTEAEFLNRRFITHQTKIRPYIILKWAQSEDGFMDRDRSKNSDRMINWISHPATKKLVHLWRSEEQAILVGRNTVENDNPRLDTREVAGPSPLRVILSRSGNLPTDSHVITDGNPTLIFNQAIDKEQGGVKWIKLEGDLLENALKHLSKMGISSVLVEGGAEVLQSFIDADLWDEARIIQSQNRLTTGLKAPEIHLSKGETQTYGRDRIIRIYNT